ncbi:M24 family metallopeptidase [Halogeometricum borinquense]|uniref:M24 family metallopeptidase n=1 Tax=Halogeometricum borinquense TaxID=60847 RepID=A0A6C0ULH0_9EURY|nr:M24 family metallopeptidase [Halogeometricum borinquense]QIB75201.1 M24 family metallopeptidase [Halogeometricum borinquense]QIQ75824.1 M24 family metallopeptidase [Halogeometricum borinquense]
MTDEDDTVTRHLDNRRERLDEYLDREGLDAVWFARPNSFSWLTGGSNVVSRDADVGVAAAGYDRDDGWVVITDNIEAQRLADEELPDEFTVEETAWYESSLADAVADRTTGSAAADFDVPGLASVNASALRQPLSETDIERYRELGRETADAVERVARELEPEDTEHEVAAALKISLSTRGINAPVVLAGGSERAQKYRHFTPTFTELGDYAILSVTAERGGLYASTTRTVAFDPPEWLSERHSQAMQVETSALAATQAVSRLNGTASSVFDNIMAAYEHLGIPEEWREHHQGGAAGYAGREWFASPDTERPVETPMAYAYNPTVQGAKSEDTVLVTEDDAEVLTTTGEWPTRPVRGWDHEFAIERHEILHLSSE